MAGKCTSTFRKVLIHENAAVPPPAPCPHRTSCPRLGHPRPRRYLQRYQSQQRSRLLLRRQERPRHRRHGKCFQLPPCHLLLHLPQRGEHWPHHHRPPHHTRRC